MNFRPVIRLLGRLLIFLAGTLLLPIFWCVRFGESSGLIAFAGVAGGAALLGFALTRVRAPDPRLYRSEGVLIVVAGWLIASIVGALPYWISGDISSPIDALFESASGFTTTGASILTDIESCGRGVLFWRSFTQWLGGLGIIVIFVALLSELGPGARFLYRVEVPGPTKEVLHARVHDTAVALLRIYGGLTLLLVVLLLFAGMSPYDALTHTFSTLSTGGFSPYNASIAAFNSPAIEVILIVFMAIAGVNFSLIYFARFDWRRAIRDRELGAYAAILSTAALSTAAILAFAGAPWVRAIRESTFQVVSVMTTTGFATADFDRWPDGARTALLALMVIGGSAGSTAGGIKVMRVLIALKTALREVRLSFSPNSVIPVTIRRAVVPNDVASAVSGFLILYCFLWGLATLTFALLGHDLLTALSATLSCLANVGPGLNLVGPTHNYAFFGDFEKCLLVMLMWMGRLEILAIVAVFRPSFWRR